MSITDKEVENMPGRDGTGPLGLGSMSGRGLGVCTGVNAVKYGSGFGLGLGMGRGFGCRRGFGISFITDPTVSKTQKELLTEQKEILQSRLDVIGKQLENL
jgi:hypothetical protein